MKVGDLVKMKFGYSPVGVVTDIATQLITLMMSIPRRWLLLYGRMMASQTRE